MIVDSTSHGMPELLVIDVKRHFSSQENIDKVVDILTNPQKRRRIQTEVWDMIVLPLVKKNDIELPLYRNNNTGYLFKKKKEDIGSIDEYAVEGACNMSS